MNDMTTDTPDIEFRDVRYTYPGGGEALRGLSFRVDRGEKVAILGPNGAGKSTMLLHTNGLLLPSAGEVLAAGVPVERKTLAEVRRSVGMVFQNPDDQLFMPTVEEDVAFGPLNMGLDQDEVERRIDAAMRAVGATGLRRRSPMQLSGGQKRAVALATVLSMQPRILEATCLIATHDLDMARRICHRAIVVDEGRAVADGPCADVLGSSVLHDILGY